MAEKSGTQPYLLEFHLTQVDPPRPIAPESTWSGVCKMQWRVNTVDAQGNPVTLLMTGSGFLLAFDGAGRSRTGLLTCHHVLFHNNAVAPSNQVEITFQQHPNTIFTLAQIADPLEQPVYDPGLDFYYQEVSPGFTQQMQQLNIQFLTRRMQPLAFDLFFLVHYPQGGERNVSIVTYIPQTGNHLNHLLYSQASTRPGSSGGALIESDGVNGFVFAMHTGVNADHTVDHSSLVTYIIAGITGEGIGPLGIPVHWPHPVQQNLSCMLYVSFPC